MGTPDLATRARSLLARAPVFDAHVDSLQRALDLGHDLGNETPGQLDLVRGRRGGLGSVVLVAWVDPARLRDGQGAAARTRALLAEFHALLARWPERVAWAGDGLGLARARAEGRIAAVAGIEGGHSIENSLERLETWFEHGVRVMTLVWNNHLSWIRSCQDGAGPGAPEGLSPFGVRVVRTMNRLGMLVDVSHAGRRSFYDVLEASDRAVIASHSGCSALHDHPRNLDDDQLRALAGRGGVVGIVFCTPFLDAGAREEEARLRATAAYRDLPAGEGPTALSLAQAEFLQREASPFPLERVLDHVCHVALVCGVEHVGLGSDYDGIQRRPAGLEDASCYGNLAEGLLRRGFGEDEVLAVLGGNMERVFAAATGPDTRAAGSALVPLGRALPEPGTPAASGRA